MRTIKFRWIAPETGKWEYVEIEDITAQIDFGKTRGQFTGLKSKGKEIYEDDVVEFMGKKLRVGFYNAHFIIFSKGGHEDLWKALERSEVKILGNIHENEELKNIGYEIKENPELKGGE